MSLYDRDNPRDLRRAALAFLNVADHDAHQANLAWAAGDSLSATYHLSMMADCKRQAQACFDEADKLDPQLTDADPDPTP